jgi:hypothetical protein
MAVKTWGSMDRGESVEVSEMHEANRSVLKNELR